MPPTQPTEDVAPIQPSQQPGFQCGEDVQLSNNFNNCSSHHPQDADVATENADLGRERDNIAMGIVSLRYNMTMPTFDRPKSHSMPGFIVQTHRHHFKTNQTQLLMVPRLISVLQTTHSKKY